MLLHPGIIALLAGSSLVTVMVLYSCYEGLKIICYWDRESSSERQLSLERKTYLLSSLIAFVLSINLLSLFLFIYTVDDLHTQFVGAMCATGTLNANTVGWWVLLLKVAIFFVSSIWILVNYIDQRTENLPFVKKKYALLILFLPLFILDVYLEVRFFLGLNPDVITSCCGALFSENSRGIASTLAGLPIRPTKYLFFTTAVSYLVIGSLAYRYTNAWLRYLMALVATFFFFVSIVSLISFISLYFYEIPTHHCPFDILQKEYHYVGYPLYITLLGSTVFGLFPGLAELMRAEGVPLKQWQKRWILTALVLLVVFCLIVLYPMVFSSFTLEGYS
jgi:hypothetical protein